ncbi:MAG: DNA methyltransferase [Candidatus Sulfotelmatobacter sp.]
MDGLVTSPPYYQQRIYGTSTSELGREPSVGQYISNLVAVFTAAPLEPWGSIWVNIGDKRGKNGALLSIPARFCIAMCDAGFHLMDHVIWAKESVRIDGASVGQAMIEPAARRLNGNGHEPFYRFALDPALTPGEMDPSLACVSNADRPRSVTNSEKDAILRAYPSPNARETEYFWLCEPCSAGKTLRLTRNGTVGQSDWQMRFVMALCRTQLGGPGEWGIPPQR